MRKYFGVFIKENVAEIGQYEYNSTGFEWKSKIELLLFLRNVNKRIDHRKAYCTNGLGKIEMISGVMKKCYRNGSLHFTYS